MFWVGLSLLVAQVVGQATVYLTIPNTAAINAALSSAYTCSTPTYISSSIKVNPGSFGNNVVGNGLITVPIYHSPDIYGCGVSPPNFTCPNGCIVLIRRGSCSFIEKAYYVENVNATAIMVYDNAPSATLASMGGEDTHNRTDPGVPAFFMSYTSGMAIAAALQVGIAVNGTLESTGPIVPAEFQALRDIANNLTLGVCDGNPPLYCLYCDIEACNFGDTRPWSDLMTGNPRTTVDPCTSRVAGIRCVDGHVVTLDIPYPLAGSLPPAIANLPYLATLIVTNPGLINDTGCVFQNLTRIRYVDIRGNLLTTFPGCNAVASLTTLNLENNQISSIPASLANAVNLIILRLGNNVLESLPPELGNLSSLGLLSFEKNSLTTVPVEFGNLQNLIVFYAMDNSLTSIPSSVLAIDALQEIYVSGNYLSHLNFTKVLPSLALLWAESNNIETFPPFITQMGTLEQLLIGSNLLSGPAPVFENFTELTLLGLNSNNFSGPVPTLNNSRSLRKLYLFENQFSGHLPDSWGALDSLLEIYLQFNNIVPPIHIMRQLPALTSVDLSHNNLSLPSLVPSAGATDAGALIFATVPSTIRSINMAYNNIEGDVDISWSGPLRDLSIINVSHNKLTSQSGVTQTSQLTILDLSVNQLQYVDEFLPSSTALRLISYAGNPSLRMQSRVLPYWLAPQPPTVLYADTSLLCLSVGLSPNVLASSSFNFQILFDPEFFSNRYCQCIPGTFGKPPDCDQIPSFFQVNSTNDTVMDSDFGDHRQIAGADIVFASPMTSSTARVRVTELVLSFGPDFAEFSDLVEVYLGDGTLKGPRLISLRGSDPEPTKIEDSKLANFESLPAQNISDVLWPTIQFRIYSDQVVIHFQSRNESGEHFRASFTHIFECPTGFVSTNSDPLLTCKPVIVPFEVSQVSAAILYLAVAIGVPAILITLGLFAKFQKTRVVRAASPLFSGLTLLSLLVFLLGSLLYAATPNTAVCHARPWFTFAPLVAILSFFISKVNRVRSIFGSVKLRSSSTHLRAKRLLQVCALLVGIMVILLIIYSSVPLTDVVEEEVRTGSTDRFVVQQTCSSNDNTMFLVWATLTALYLFGILAWGIYNAYAIRNTPSAFNESTHILQCLVGLFTLLILCGLFVLVLPSNPDLVLIVWGLGQALASLFIFAALFGPKLLALARGGNGPSNAATGSQGKTGSQLSGTMSQRVIDVTGSYSKENEAAGPPKTELEIMADRLDNAEKALKAQRQQFEHMFREWGWTGELN